MKMRQSLSHFERAFEEEMEIDRERREAIRRATERRARKRTIERNVRMGRMRFVVLSFTLATTAIVVSVVMFKVLYLLMDLTPVDRNAARRLDADSHLFTDHRQHRHLDLFPDHDALVGLSRQHEHFNAPPSPIAEPH
jgi:hypothetical protein